MGVSSVASLCLKELARIVDQHRLELVAGDAALLKGRYYVVMNVKEMPPRQHGRQRCLGQPVVKASGIVRQYHLVCSAAGAQLCDGVDAVFEWQDRVNAKPVHPDI